MLSLSKKKYWDSLDSSVDTVIMFVPGDNFLQAALKEDPKIFLDAMKHKVIVTGPQTLLLTLRFIPLCGQRINRLVRLAKLSTLEKNCFVE